MNNQASLLKLIEAVQRKAPAYCDLLSARTVSEFDNAFDVLLEHAIRKLEEEKLVFATLGEEGLSAVLVAALSIPGVLATRETYSNGHVDITITADHCNPIRKKLGEAKIYDGPEYHLKGLEQLIGRYSTGRDGRAMLIIYFRKKDIKKLVKKIREKMDEELPFKQEGFTEDHTLNWSFLSKHKHSSGEVLEVGHIGCNLYIQTDDDDN